MKILGYIIVIKRSGTDGTPYPLTSANPSCSIGRGIECDIRVQLPVVSLQHCRIEVEASGKAYITNVSSSNPAYLNDVRLCPEEVKLLSHSDVIHIADRKLRWEYPEESALCLPASKENSTFKILTPKSKAPPVNYQQEVPSSGDGNAEEQILDATRNKKVSFGRELNPEHFDKQLPPSTPVRKGEKPDGCAFATPYTSSSVKRTTRLSVLPSTPSIPEETGAETPTKSLLRRRSPTPIKPYLARSLGLLTPKSLQKNNSTLEQTTSKVEVNGDSGFPLSECSPSSSPTNGAPKSSPQSSVQSPKGIASPTLSSSKPPETPEASLSRLFSDETPETSCLKSPKSVNTKRSPSHRTDVDDSQELPETPNPKQSLRTPSPKISSKPISAEVGLETVSHTNLSKTPEALSTMLDGKSPSDIPISKSASKSCGRRSSVRKSSVNPDQRSLEATNNGESVLDTKQDPESVTSSSFSAVDETSPQTREDSVTPQNLEWQLEREAKCEDLGASPALKRRKAESDIIKEELKNSQRSRRSLSVDANSSQSKLLTKASEMPQTVNLAENVSKDTDDFVISNEANVIPSPKKGRGNELAEPLGVCKSSPRKLDLGKRRSLRTPRNTKPESLGFSKSNTPVVLFNTETKTKHELHSMPEVDDPNVSNVNVLETSVLDKSSTLRIQEEDMSRTPVLSKTKTPKRKTPKNEASQIEEVDVDVTPEISKTETIKVKTPKGDLSNKSEMGMSKTPKVKMSEDDYSQTIQVPVAKTPNVRTPRAVAAKMSEVKANLTPNEGTPKTLESNPLKPDDSPKKDDGVPKTPKKDDGVLKTPKAKTPKMKTPKVDTIKTPFMNKLNSPRVDTPSTTGEDIPDVNETKSPQGGEKAKTDEDTPKKHDKGSCKTPKAKTPQFDTPKITEVDISSSLNDISVTVDKTHKSSTPKTSRVHTHLDEASPMATATSLEVSENVEPEAIIEKTCEDESFEVIEKEELSSLDVEDDCASEKSNGINRSRIFKYASKRKSLGKLGDRVGVCRTSIRVMDLGKRKTPMRKILKPVSVKKTLPRYKSPSVSSNVEQGSKRKASLSPASPMRKKIKIGTKTPNAGSKPEAFKSGPTKTPKRIGKTPKKSWADIVKKGLMAHGIPAAKAQRASTVMNKARIHRRTRKQEVIENCVPSFNPEFPKSFNFTQSTGHINSPAPIIIRKKMAKTPKIYRKGQKSVKQGTTIESIEEIDLEGLANLLNTPKSKEKDMIKQITGWSLPDIVNHYTPLSKAVRMKELLKNSGTAPLSNVPSQETKTPGTSFSPSSSSTVTPPGKDVSHSTNMFSPVTPPNANVSRRTRSVSSVTNTPVSRANTTNFDFCAVKTPDLTGDNLISPLVTPNVCVKSSEDLFSSNESLLESPLPNETDCTTFDFDNAVTPAVTPDVFVSPMSTRSRLTTPRVAKSQKALKPKDSDIKNTPHPPELQVISSEDSDVKEMSPSDVNLLDTPKNNSSSVLNTKRLLRMPHRSSAGKEVECTKVNDEQALQTSQVEEESQTADNSDATNMKLEEQETPTKAQEFDGTNRRRTRLSRTSNICVPESDPNHTDVDSIKKLCKTPTLEQEPGNKYSSEKKKLRISDQVVESHGFEYSDISGISEHEPDYTDIDGVENMLRNSMTEQESDHTNEEMNSKEAGVEKLIKTPKADTPRHEPNYTNVTGIETPQTPVIEKEPDFRNCSVMEKLQTPEASVESSENEHSDVAGFNKMMETPKVTSGPEADDADVANMKQLSTPKPTTESLAADDTHVHSIKKLLKTPKTAVEITPGSDVSDVTEVKKLMKTPSASASPAADYTNLEIKKLMTTPVEEVPEREADYSHNTGIRKSLRKSKAVPKSPQADYSQVAGMKKLLSTPKAVPESPQADYSQVAGMKKLLSTPKAVPESPQADYTQVAGMKKLLSAPKAVPESPQADYTQVAGMKKLLSTAKAVPESPQADYTQVAGMKKLLSTPKAVPESPQADYTQVAGMKKLLSTPMAVPESPQADYTQVAGMKKLLSTPKAVPESPQADYTHVAGMKKLLSTPKAVPESPQADYTQVAGMKKLLSTPKAVSESPQADYTSVHGLQKLLKTPRRTKNVEPDYSSPQGLEMLMKTPRKIDSEPLSDYTNVEGIKSLLKTTAGTMKSPQADYTQVYGVRSLLKTPKATRKSFDADLDGLSHIMKTPLSDNSNVEQLLEMVKESVSSAKQSGRTPSVISPATGTLSENIPPKDDLKTVVDLVRDESVKEMVSPRRSRRNNKDTSSKILDLVQETEKTLVKDDLRSVDLVMDGSIQYVASPCKSNTNDDTPKTSSRKGRRTAKAVDSLEENHVPDDAMASKPNKRGRRNATLKESNADQESNIEREVGKKLSENINLEHLSNNVSTIKNYEEPEETEEKKSTPLKRSKRQQVVNVCKSDEEILVSPSVDSIKVKEELSAPQRRGRRRPGKDIQSGREDISAVSDKDSSEVTKEKGEIQKSGRGRQVKGILVLEKSSTSSLDMDNVQEHEMVKTPQRRGRRQKVTFENISTPQDSNVDTPVKGRRRRNVTDINTDITSAPQETSVPAKRGRGSRKIVKEEETIVQEGANSITVLEVEKVKSDECSAPAKSHKGTKRTRTKEQTKENAECTEKDSEDTLSTKNRSALSKSSIVDSENKYASEKSGDKENEFKTSEGCEGVTKDTEQKIRSVKNHQAFAPSSESSPAANDEKSVTETIVKEVQLQSIAKELKSEQYAIEEKSSPAVRRGRRKKAVEECDSSTEDISEIQDEKHESNKKVARAPRRTRGQPEKSKAEESLPQDSKGNLQKTTVDKHGSSTEDVSESLDDKTEDDKKPEKVVRSTRGRPAKTKAGEALSQHFKDENLAVEKSVSSTKAMSESVLGETDGSKKTGRATRRTKDQSAKTKAEAAQSQHLKEDVLEKTGLGEKEGKPSSKSTLEEETTEKATKKSGRQPRAKKTLEDDIDAKIEEVPVSKPRRGSKRKDATQQEEEAPPTKCGNKKVVVEKDILPTTRRGNKKVAAEEEIQTTTKRGSRKKPAEEDIASPPKRVSRRTRAQK